MRKESGEAPDEFRIDLERVVVDPDYRRRVLAHLRAATLAGASSPPPSERSDPALVDSTALGPMLGRGRA